MWTMRDTCSDCGERVTVPMSVVVISYHRSDTRRDLYRFGHPGCRLTFKPLTPESAERLDVAITERKVVVEFTDAEFDDGAHRLPPWTEYETVRFVRELAAIASVGEGSG